MKILLSGDWQSQTTNLDLCRRALEVELALLAKEKITVHIDTGDSKEEYSPVAVGVTNFQLERARKIAAVVPHRFRVLGNHDRIGQHSDSRNWMTIFSDHCQCITKSNDLRIVDNVLLAFLPYNKDVSETIAAAATHAKHIEKMVKAPGGNKLVPLLIFHCDVKGAKYSNTRTATSESKLSVDKLKHEVYKQCFGGHIHKRQTLAGNVHYCGNPFPTDMGEVNQEKGFLIYDTDTDKIKFVPSGLPCIYTYDYLKKKNIKKVPDGTQIKHTVAVSTKDDYYTVLGNASAEIEKRYPNAIPFVLPEFEESLSTVDDSIKLDIDASEQDQVTSYLDITAKTDALREVIEAYMLYILSVVSKKAGYAKGLTIEEVEAHNILSFKDVKFSFRDKGICLVRGKNKDWPGHSNGAGKSNLLALLPIILSGRTFKEQKFTDIVNDYTPDEKAWGTLRATTKSGDKLEVYRQFNPSKLIFTINGKDASQGMRSNGKKDTQGLIEEYTGYTFATLANAVYIDQSMTQSFLLGTDKDRAELLHKFQNLDRFAIAQKLSNIHYSLTKKIIEELDHEKEIQNVLLKETKERLEELEAIHSNQVATLRKTWFKHSTAYDKALTATQPKIDKWNNRIASVTKSSEHLQSSIDEIEEAIVKLKAKKQYVTGLKVKLEQATKGASCSSCLRPVNAKRKARVLTTYTAQVGNIEALIERKELELKRPNKALVAQEAASKELEYKVAKAKDDLAWLRDTSVNSHKAYKSEKEALKTTETTKAVKNKIRRIKDRFTSLAVLREDYVDTLTVIGRAYKAFGRDGLPLFLNRLVCPRLNAASKYYSELFVDKEIQVIFEISDSYQLVPKIVNSHGGKKLSGQSQGEKAWGGIITAFAIRDIAQPTNLLILDEPGNGLDSQGARQLGERITKLKDKFETLIVVTHNQNIEAALTGSNTVTVVKKNKVSTVVEA